MRSWEPSGLLSNRAQNPCPRNSACQRKPGARKTKDGAPEGGPFSRRGALPSGAIARCQPCRARRPKQFLRGLCAAAACWGAKSLSGTGSLFMLLWSQAFYCCASCSDLTLLHLQALVNLPGQDRQSQHSSSASRPHTPPMTDHMSAGRGWLAMRTIGPAGLAAWQKVF